MKRNNKVIRYDYSRFDRDKFDGDYYFEYEFWGIHPKHGRIHIDTKRYKYIINHIFGKTEFTPDDLFKLRKTPYYTPTKIHRNDYLINVFADYLNELKNDWEQEYKILFSAIKTPSQVKEDYRSNAIMFTSNVDDLDEIEVDSLLEGIKRENKYNKIIKSLYCQMIVKICTEVNRILVNALKEVGYKRPDFSFSNFESFSDGKYGKKCGVAIQDLKEFDCYNKLNKICNFLKHNTKRAYDDLKKFYPSSVASIENKKTETPYENGYFAGDYIIFEKNYIDNLFTKLMKFFEDYCSIYLKENTKRAYWDYDDFFKDAYNKLKRPSQYLGI